MKSIQIPTGVRIDSDIFKRWSNTQQLKNEPGNITMKVSSENKILGS